MQEQHWSGASAILSDVHLALPVSLNVPASHPPPVPPRIVFSLCPDPNLHHPGLSHHLARIVADAEAAEAHAVVILALGVLGDFALIVAVLGEELVQLC